MKDSGGLRGDGSEGDRLTEDDVVVIGGVDARARNGFANDDLAQRPCGQRGELAARAPDRRAERGDDDGVVSWHEVTLARGCLRAPECARSAHPFALLLERQKLLGLVPGAPFRVELPVIRRALDRHAAEQPPPVTLLLALPIALPVP